MNDNHDGSVPHAPDPPTPGDDRSSDLRQGAQQMAQGASKLASGAAHFARTRVGPAIERGAQTARTSFSERSEAAGGF